MDQTAAANQSQCDELAAAVLAYCETNHFKIAAAESLTGGLLADAFVRVPGASKVFLGSAVTYDIRAKASILGVDAELLRSEGAVHPEVARQMALTIAGGDLSLKAEVSGKDELTDLQRALDQMQQSLGTTVAQVRDAGGNISVASQEIASGNQDLSTDELRTMVLESGAFIPPKHRSILVNLFELEDITVEDVMMPRSQIEAVRTLTRALMTDPVFIIDNITLRATSSPEGSWRVNDRLARERASAVKEVLVSEFRVLYDSLRIASGYTLDERGNTVRSEDRKSVV